MSRDSDGNLTLGAASTYQVSDDGTRYEFQIRSDATWSNGDAVTASDFVRGLRLAASPSRLAPQAELLEPIKNFRAVHDGALEPHALGVFAPDEKTVVIELANRTPYFLAILEYPISYPIHALDQEAATNPTVYNGAYKVETIDFNRQIVLTKNDDYWNSDSVAIEVVRYVSIDDETTSLNRFRAGEIDLTASVPNHMMEWIRKNADEEYRAFPQLGTYFVALDVTEPPFSDSRVRRALSISIDRQSLVEDVLRGGQIPTESFVPPGLPTFSADLSRPKGVRFSEASELLHSAGYSESKPMEVRLVYNVGDNNRRIALFLADSWERNLPVSVTLSNVEFGVLLQLHRNRSDWDALRSSWNADYPDAYNFLQIFRSGHTNNVSGFSSKEYDRLLDESHDALEDATRIDILQRAERLLVRANPAIFLYYYVDRRLVSSRVKGFTSNSLAINRSQHLSLFE